MDPHAFYQGTHKGTGDVTLVNDHGVYSAVSDTVDEILEEAFCKGDSSFAAVQYLLRRFSDSAGIDIPDDNYSPLELAVMIAHVEKPEEK